MTNHSTPKLFVLQFGALLALYVTLSFLITLLFTVINIQVPDATDGAWRYESYLSSARLGIAVVLVFFPVYLGATYLVMKARRLQHTGYVTPVRWLLYVSLLAAAAVLLGNLVYVILTFLEGEVTTRFVLRVLTMVVLIGGVLGFYVLDVRDYWLEHSKAGRMVGVVASLVVFAALALGFYSIISPSEARDRSLDAQQVSDLQTIAGGIERYVDQEGSLPASVDEVFRLERQIPTAPEDRPAYEYHPGDNLSYELCAHFAAPSPEAEHEQFSPPLRGGGGYYVDWVHEAGDWCFAIELERDEE